MTDQITKLQPGNHQPMGVDWAGTDVEKEDETDMVPDGTDYKPKGKSVKKSFRLYKSLIQDEELLKAMDDEDEDESRGERADVDKYEYEEGKEAAEEDDVKKSFFDYVEDNPTLMAGIESSPFLYEMVKSMGYSFLNLEDRLGTQMFLMDHHHDTFAKSVDGVFYSLSKSLGFINGTADEIGLNKSGNSDGNVQYLEKSGFGDATAPDRGQILDALMKGVEAGQIPSTEVIKFETTGAVSPHIQKSLGL